jgi:L,D-peptidoglycan transpeptidase YkuD (ErfK/YbiS/YcfS/YnhG family)|tara:strand:- start:125 stop:616 length:492 start_codon:yes stop_codon:yes gene_type:complete
MTIKIKNKYTLLFDEFEFKCSIGAFGFTSDKYEGDKKTPTGLFSLGDLYYRSDKVQKPKTKLKCIKIKKNMGWCNDIDSKFYNKKIKIKKKVRYEKLFRNDYKYNYLIPIKYNWVNPKKNKGSAIFIHLTKNYNPTAGCIALSLKDFLILVKLIKKNTKIRII